ncbi:YceI family protein [Galbibacter sp. EGI 63066]|uniref:YceI family protein n=1 Tax=Galbibacter sp. EGI 63066 TaxID=2993559 RepID=UPI002248BABE|nr:YceI family protein [Galbibacter sp. EGI 63066]MCX2678562.1 YceI family protein [Galbibacter sp. EGI 63066]
MKKNILAISIIALMTVFTACKKGAKNEASTAEAETATATTEAAVKYKAVPGESIIEWKGSKPTGTHIGTVTIESGVISLKNGVVESGNFLIDMKTITVTDLEPGDGKENLEAHLKGTVEGKQDHFFNVKEHPTAYFEVTGVEKVEGKTMLKGNLALKGQKKNIAFPVSVTENGDAVILKSEAFPINRTDWGVNYGSKSIFDDLGDKFINDEIELAITVKATKA